MDSAGKFVLRIFGTLAVLLIAISSLRAVLGGEYLSFSFFLESLQEIEFNFSRTLGHIAVLARDFTFVGIPWYQAIGNALKGIYDLLVFPVKCGLDLLEFVMSVLHFIVKLLGVDIFGIFTPTGNGGRPF